MEPVFDEIRAWLDKAGSDLLAAQILIEHSALALGPAAFHCQQTAEKVFKAFLIFKTVPFDRVHNLVYLLDLCETAEPDLATLRKAAESLTPMQSKSAIQEIASRFHHRKLIKRLPLPK